MIFNSASRARVREAERLWLVKLVLRILTFVLVSIGIILISVALSSSPANRISDYFLLPWLLIPVYGNPLPPGDRKVLIASHFSLAYLGLGI